MAKLQYLNVAGLQRYDEKSVARMNKEIVAAKAYAKSYADGLAPNYDAAGTAQTKINELVTTGQVKTNTDAIALLNGGVDQAGSVAHSVNAAKTELEGKITNSMYDDTAVKASIKANTDAIAILNGTKEQDGSVKKEVALQIAAIVNENNNGSIDTLNEIAAWIANNPNNAATMNAAIEKNAGDITSLKALVGTLPEGATATSVVGYVDEKVGGLKTTLEGAIATAKSEAISTAASDATSKANQAKADAIADAASKDTALKTEIETAYKAADKAISDRLTDVETSLATGGATAQAIANAQSTANTAVTNAAKAQGDVDALKPRVTALEGLVGEGFEPIPDATIDALFPTTEGQA